MSEMIATLATMQPVSATFAMLVVAFIQGFTTFIQIPTQLLCYNSKFDKICQVVKSIFFTGCQYVVIACSAI